MITEFDSLLTLEGWQDKGSWRPSCEHGRDHKGEGLVTCCSIVPDSQLIICPLPFPQLTSQLLEIRSQSNILSSLGMPSMDAILRIPVWSNLFCELICCLCCMLSFLLLTFLRRDTIFNRATLLPWPFLSCVLLSYYTCCILLSHLFSSWCPLVLSSFCTNFLLEREWWAGRMKKRTRRNKHSY